MCDFASCCSTNNWNEIKTAYQFLPLEIINTWHDTFIAVNSINMYDVRFCKGELMDNWNEIRTAYQVARLGTVTAAAKILGIHRATVIRHINTLEQRFFCAIHEDIPVQN